MFGAGGPSTAGCGGTGGVLKYCVFGVVVIANAFKRVTCRCAPTIKRGSGLLPASFFTLSIPRLKLKNKIARNSHFDKVGTGGEEL